jgi:hypothetical protein
VSAEVNLIEIVPSLVATIVSIYRLPSLSFYADSSS